MTMTELRNEFIKHGNELFFVDVDEPDVPNDLIEKLSNDVATLLYIDMLITNENYEYDSIEYLFDDCGFVEFLQMQYENPLTFDEMCG